MNAHNSITQDRCILALNFAGAAFKNSFIFNNSQVARAAVSSIRIDGAHTYAHIKFYILLHVK